MDQTYCEETYILLSCHRDIFGILTWAIAIPWVFPCRVELFCCPTLNIFYRVYKPFLLGFHIGAPFSKCGLIIVVNTVLKISLFMCVKFLLIIPVNTFAFFTFLWIWVSNERPVHDYPKIFFLTDSFSFRLKKHFIQLLFVVM